MSSYPLRVSSELYARIRDAAWRSRVTVADWLRRAIERQLDSETPLPVSADPEKGSQ